MHKNSGPYYYYYLSILNIKNSCGSQQPSRAGLVLRTPDRKRPVAVQQWLSTAWKLQQNYLFSITCFDFLTARACASLSEQPWVIHKIFTILNIVQPLFLRKQGPGPHGWRRANAMKKIKKTGLSTKRQALLLLPTKYLK